MKEFPHIKNGNFVVKTKLPKGTKGLISGVHRLGKLKCLISRFGESPRCLICNAEGHIRKDCPKRGLKCGNCSKVGHTVEECTLALRLQENHLEMPLEEEEEAPRSDAESSAGNLSNVSNQVPEKQDIPVTIYQKEHQEQVSKGFYTNFANKGSQLLGTRVITENSTPVNKTEKKQKRIMSSSSADSNPEPKKPNQKVTEESVSLEDTIEEEQREKEKN